MKNNDIFHNQLSGVFLVMALLLVCGQSKAQQMGSKPVQDDAFCGFEMSPSEREAYQATARAHRAFLASHPESSPPPILYTPVIFHIVRNSDGDGVSIDQVQQALAWANEYFAPANIQFFQCAPPEIIVSNTWYNRQFCFRNMDGDCAPSRAWESEFDDTYQVANVVNIYCLRTDGWSWYRSGTRYLVLNQGHAGGRAILAHELGHYSGLAHTFQGLDENVTRNPLNSCYNCETAGDGFCDTPADHHDRGGTNRSWSTGCVPDYATDECDAILHPDGLNIMSYSNSACPNEDKYFSPEQRSRMYYVIGTVRSYLDCNSDCVAEYNLSGTHHTTRTYRVWNTIRSTATIADNVSITYQAEDYVQLNPGFRAIAGTTETFSAIIAHCVDNIAGDGNAELNTGPGENRSSKIQSDSPARASQFSVTPNPFSSTTVISYSLAEPQKVSLQVFNATGEMVGNLVQEQFQEAGSYSYPFEANTLPSGLYLIMLQQNGERTTKRVALTR